MAKMTIRLVCDLTSGKRDVIISLSEDAESLPHEHEQRHRELVDQLIEGGLLKPDELGQIIVEREEEQAVDVPSDQARPQRESEAEGAS